MLYRFYPQEADVERISIIIYYFFSYTDVYSRIQNPDRKNGLPPSQNKLHTMSTRCGLSINLGRNRLDLEIHIFITNDNNYIVY